jgi:hypothetical protein
MSGRDDASCGFEGDGWVYDQCLRVVRLIAEEEERKRDFIEIVMIS